MHQDSFKERRRAGFGVLSFLTAILLGASAAPAGATDINLGKHIKEVKVSGDLRLRQESFMPGSPGGRGRSRQRYRLRVGTELPLSDNMKAKLRFASGTGEQVSTNQSFDNLSAQNAFWIDMAMLEYKPLDFLKLTGGRMSLPLWTVYSSDLVWDGDFSPMGFGLGAERLVGPVNVFANTMYMVVDEDSSNKQGSDQYEVSAQIGTEFKLPLESRLRIAGALHEWVNETTTTRKNAGTFSQAATNNGNRRYASGVLQNEFKVREITGQLSFWVMRVPVHVQGTFIRNVAALDSLSTPKKADKGSQVGAIVKPGKFELAYFVKDAETDATVADVSDSDFGNGGTGRKGSIMWVSYKPQDFGTFTVKYFTTELEHISLSPGSGKANDLDRLQVDYVVKF